MFVVEIQHFVRGGKTTQRREKARKEAKRLEGIILPLRQQGKSLRVICNVLNETGITTSRGKAFHPSKVKRTLSILEVA